MSAPAAETVAAVAEDTNVEVECRECGETVAKNQIGKHVRATHKVKRARKPAAEGAEGAEAGAADAEAKKPAPKKAAAPKAAAAPKNGAADAKIAELEKRVATLEATISKLSAKKPAKKEVDHGKKSDEMSVVDKGERPHHCVDCDRFFKTSKSLKNHRCEAKPDDGQRRNRRGGRKAADGKEEAAKPAEGAAQTE